MNMHMLVLILCFACCASGCIPSTQEATFLLAFKASLSDPLGSLSTWEHNSSNAWIGIQCAQQGRVMALQLPSLSLHGSISSPLGHLSFLHTLDLSSNNFSGNIPPWLFTNCTSLQLLDLSDNTFISGAIPQQVGLLHRLTVLNLWGNALTGVIPSTLANCSVLEQLELNTNQLSGGIPSELGMLSHLRVLYLWQNQLTGGIPPTLANCSAMEDLELVENSLSGEIPPELGKLQRMTLLLLAGNGLSGSVPTTLGNCSSLEILDLVQNQLSGQIPHELGLLKQLTRIRMHHNNLTGAIPASLMNCTLLVYMWLDHNQFSGEIPLQIGNLRSLQECRLQNNNLSGALPTTLLNCTALVRLQMSTNQLTASEAFLRTLFESLTQLQALLMDSNRFEGNLPDAFYRCTNLTWLDLSHNSFTGILPLSLATLKLLTHVRFEQNQLQGTIPTMFSTSLLLGELNLSFNNLSGSIPDRLADLPALVTLDLSNNYLGGQVPPQLGKLNQLQSLDLSTNILSGQIPAALSGCLQLVSLNLSYNKLSGNVPANLANLSSLSSLDLSYNQLNGSLPQLSLFENASISNFSGNPGLCGQILHRACNTTAFVATRSTFKPELVVIIIVVVSVVFVAISTILVTWCMKCSRRKTAHLKDDLLRGEFTPEELEQATNQFSQENIIGFGSVSVVFKASLPLENAPVAVKVIKKEVAVNGEARFRKEVQVLSKVRHRNIVKIYGCCVSREIKALILELMPNGNLAEHCYGNVINKTPFTMEDKLRVLRGIAHGLYYLHELHPDGPIVHSDIKPENILLDADLEPHIADFGIAKLLDDNSNGLSTSLLLRGSVGYIPPEYGCNSQASTKGDVYSFGVVMLELLTGKRPSMFNDALQKEQSLVSWARSAYLHDEMSIFNVIPLTEHAAKRVIQVALMCTNDVPSSRPTMHEVTQHLFTNLRT